jgi:hypothetical protein
VVTDSVVRIVHVMITKKRISNNYHSVFKESFFEKSQDDFFILDTYPQYSFDPALHERLVDSILWIL